MKTHLAFVMVTAALLINLAVSPSQLSATQPDNAMNTLLRHTSARDARVAAWRLVDELEREHLGEPVAPRSTATDVHLPRCLAATETGLRLSSLAFTGCPSDASAYALAWAWMADTLAASCSVGLADCQDASYAALLSAAYWEYAFETCTLAEAAAANEAVAWWTCGAWSAEQPEPGPTPTPQDDTPTPDNTPTPDPTSTPTVSWAPQTPTPTAMP